MSKKSKMGVTKWAKWVSGTLLCKFTSSYIASASSRFMLNKEQF